MSAPRLSRVLFWSVALILAVLAPAVALAQPPAPLRAMLFTSTVRWSTTPGSEVRVILRGATSTKASVTATAGADGEVVVNFGGGGGGGGAQPRDTTVRSGDSIGVHPAAGVAFTRTVPALAVGIDAATRTVAGTAPADALLDVSVALADGTDVYSATVNAAADGRFSFVVPMPVALGAGSSGRVNVTTADGDVFTARWDVLGAQLTLDDSAVTGRATLGSTVLVEIGSTTGIKARTGNQPTTILRTPTFNLTLRAGTQVRTVAVGDLVTVTQSGAVALTGTVPGITVRIDPVTERVTGSAPPGAALVVSAEVSGGGTVDLPAVAGPTGDYVALFTGLADLGPGSRVFTTLTSGELTYRALGVGEQVRATLYSATVRGSGAPGADVVATLREGGAGGALRANGSATVGSNGTFQFNLTEAGGTTSVRTAPGNRLIVAIGVGATPTELVLPDLQATVDVDTDHVTGVALPNAPVAVTVAGQGGATIETTADGAGRFDASFSGQRDLVPGSTGTISVGVDGGHTVSMAFAAPRVSVTLGSATVTGAGPNGRTVTLSVSRAGSTVATAQVIVGAGGGGGGGGGGGSAWTAVLRDGANAAVPLLPGDRLSVSVGGWSLELAVPNVTVDVNATTDVVSGVAEAGRTVNVTVSPRQGQGSETVTVVAGADGRFVADFAGRWDIAAGNNVSVVVELAGGHTVTAPSVVPGLVVMLQTGIVSGTATPGTAVAATLKDGGGTVRATGATNAEGNGNFSLTLRDTGGAPVRPATGDRLEVQFGTNALAMVIPMLTGEFDLTTDVVSGSATVGGSVSVRAVPLFGGQGSSRTVTVEPDVGGRYVADFARQLNLRAGALLEIGYETPEGHVARLDIRVPMLHAQKGGIAASGFAAANASVTASLRRGAQTLATATATAAADGAYNVEFRAGGAPVVIAVGDVVGVSWTGGVVLVEVNAQPAGSMEMTVAPMTASIDAATRTISGTTVPSTTVRITLRGIGGGGIGGGGGGFTLNATSDAAGEFSIQVPGGGMIAGLSAEVGVIDETGYRTYVVANVPFLELTIGEAGLGGLGSPMGDLGLQLSEAGTVLGSVRVAADTFGRFTATLNPTTGAPSVVQPGRRVTLEDPSSGTVEVDVPNLTAVLDTAGHTLAGVGPANTNLTLRLSPTGQNPVDVQTRTDDAGAWSIDDGDLPPGASYTIGDLTRAEARLLVGTGHRVIAVATTGNLPTPTTPTPGASQTPTSTPVGPSPSATPTGPAPRNLIYLPMAMKG